MENEPIGQARNPPNGTYQPPRVYRRPTATRLVKREIALGEIPRISQPKETDIADTYPAINTLHPAIQAAIKDTVNHKEALRDMAALESQFIELCRWCGEKANGR